MFSFIRWIKELSLDVSLDDFSACEGYPSLQAVEKMQRLRAEVASGRPQSINKGTLPRAENSAPSGGRVIVSFPTVAAPANDAGDAAPAASSLRSAG